MKRKVLYLLIFFVVCIFLTVIFSRYSIDNIKKNPIKYCYQTYFGPPNSVLVIESLSYKDSLINYYKRVENGENPSFNFPLKTLPQYEPVYVISYTKDSLLAEVVSYYDRGTPNGGSYLRCYVVTKTLHDNPPSKK
jgi:hypothetical protein